MREKLKESYSDTGRPSIDPELLLRIHVAATCAEPINYNPMPRWNSCELFRERHNFERNLS